MSYFNDQEENKKFANANNAPLLCWDIFMEGFHKRMHLADDLRMIEKIRLENDWLSPCASPDNALIWQDKVILITNTSFNIVYATENIFAMNGYMPHEVTGRNPRMFQGKETTEQERHIIRTAINNLSFFDTTITNYKKDGATYKCHVEGYPIFNTRGVLVNFVAHENAA